MNGALDGKVAIVTGGGRGIGRGIAQELAVNGARVVVNDAGLTLAGDTEGLSPATEVVSSIEAVGGQAVAVTESVSTFEGGQRIVEAALDNFGQLDIVVTAAGILRDRMIFNMTEQEWDDVINVHLKGTFTVVKYASTIFRKQQSGRIITFSSTSGLYGNSGQANYAAAKAGTTGMTKAIAAEVASRGITVNCVAPGYIVTPMTDSLDDSQKESLLTMIPIGRLGKPKDVAACVSFLASEEAAYVTGQTLHVNGGMLMI